MQPDEGLRAKAKYYALLRHQHAAWSLLAARRAPLMLACAEQLFADDQQSVLLDDAVALLAEMLEQFANDDFFAVSGEDYMRLARREWREWINRKLMIERDGVVLATDALQRALAFVQGIGRRSLMTSSASRLAVVQREIQHLAMYLNPDVKARRAYLQQQIEQLQAELEAVERGEMVVLNDEQALENIADTYGLAVSLRADFRRVEDSYRLADQQLRESIVREEFHRGDVVDALLDSHDKLIDTPEGQVFQGFNLELRQALGLQRMQKQIRQILAHPMAKKALDLQQDNEFRWLVMYLNKEAGRVNRARERTERDVRGFMQTGLAREHHRVGTLLKQLFAQALDMDWQSASLRRCESVLPALGLALDGLPVIARLRFNAYDAGEAPTFSLQAQTVDLDEVDDEFWLAFDGLDRQDWLAQTKQVLAEASGTLSLAQLSERLVPDGRYDLEALALWIELAREGGLPIDSATEVLNLSDETGRDWQFTVPKVALDYETLKDIEE